MFIVILPLAGATTTLEYRLSGQQAEASGGKIDEALGIFDGPLIIANLIGKMFQNEARGDYNGTSQAIDFSTNPSLDALCRDWSQYYWNGPRHSVTGFGIDNSITTVFGTPVDTATLNYYMVGRAMGASSELVAYGYPLLLAAMLQGAYTGAPNKPAKKEAFGFGYWAGLFGEPDIQEMTTEIYSMYALTAADPVIGSWVDSLWPNFSSHARNVVSRPVHNSLFECCEQVEYTQYFSHPGFLDLSVQDIENLLLSGGY
jgi:hypothetical protein